MVKKIAASQLRKGMYVCGTDRKWIDIPFFLTKFLVKSDKQIHTLTEYCQCVYIDTSKGLDVDRPRDLDDGAAPAETFIEQTIDQSPARTVYQQSQIGLAEFFTDVRRHKSLTLARIERIVVALLDSMVADRNVLLEFAQSGQPAADPLACKSVNVAILAIATGAFLEMPQDQLRLLGLGALLHDVGLLRVPEDILARTGALTPPERAEIKRHADYGVALLADMPDLPSEVSAIVAEHHERLDGGGYPRGVPGKAIGDLVRIVAIASAYEALIGKRVYHEALPPAVALAHLYGSESLGFDAGLVGEFMRMLGIYPVGCVLELQGGELAIVTEGSLRCPSRLRVNIITDARKQLLFQEKPLELGADDQQIIVKVLASDEPILALLQTFTSLEKIQ